MSYSSDLTDEQWALLEPVFNTPGKRGPKHAPGLRTVVDAMLYISHTGCQWRYLPESFGPWTRVWSQFRRWSRNGTWARALTVLHAAAREADGRAEATPSMLVIDTHLARGASNGGLTFHDRGGPYGRTKGAKRVVAVDVTGLPMGALVVRASTHENRTSELMLEHLTRQGVTGRLELVLVDRGVTAAAARTFGRHHDLELRRGSGLVQHDDMSTLAADRIRTATAADAAQLLPLWALVFDEDDTALATTWKQHAQEWFTRFVEDPTTARFPVIEVDGDVVATAIGTLELGVPNPQCLRGRTVRLANVITVPEHRGKGYGTLLVRDVIGWARSIDADRVDLSATPDGQRIYEKVGFNLTKAPRMKLVL